MREDTVKAALCADDVMAQVNEILASGEESQKKLKSLRAFMEALGLAAIQCQRKYTIAISAGKTAAAAAIKVQHGRIDQAMKYVSDSASKLVRKPRKLGFNYGLQHFADPEWDAGKSV